MKRLATFMFALLLAASLSFAQTGGGAGKSDKPQESSKKETKSGKKGHKGGKRSKKNSGGTTTATPK